MKILFFSDTHLGFDYPIRPRIVRRRRGQDFFNNFERVLKYSLENKIDLIIHGGDFFFRSKVPQQIVTKAYEILFEFAENSIPFIIVPGNHERSRLPQSILTRHPNIYIFEKPQTFFFNFKGINIGVSGFPYERNNVRDNFLKIIQDTNWNEEYANIKILCFHHAVEGSKVKNFTFRSGKDVIRGIDIPENFHCILSGHIHRKQILWFRKDEKQVPVIYSGSTERTSFQEKNEGKGFYILYFRQFCNGWRLVKTDFKILPIRPMIDIFIDWKIKDRKRLENFLKDQIAKLDQDAIVRIRCNYPEIISYLKADFLWEIFPKTMNWQVSYLFGKR